MSVCSFRADRLCLACSLKGRVIPCKEGDTYVTLAIEANDLCRECVEAKPTPYLEFIDPTTEIAKLVRKNSPYLRRQRWIERWWRIKAWFIHKWERFDRWNHYGRKAMLPRPNMCRCCSCGYNFLYEDLDPVSGDGEMCAPCLETYCYPPGESQ